MDFDGQSYVKELFKKCMEIWKRVPEELKVKERKRKSDRQVFKEMINCI